MTLSLDDVRNKRFRMARKSGYEVLEVDEFVDEVEESFAQLIEENQNLKKQVESLKSSSPLRPPPRPRRRQPAAKQPRRSRRSPAAPQPRGRAAPRRAPSWSPPARRPARPWSGWSRCRPSRPSGWSARPTRTPTGSARKPTGRPTRSPPTPGPGPSGSSPRPGSTPSGCRPTRSAGPRRSIGRSRPGGPRCSATWSSSATSSPRPSSALRTFEATYRTNLTDHLRSQIESLESGRAEPTDVPERRTRPRRRPSTNGAATSARQRRRRIAGRARRGPDPRRRQPDQQHAPAGRAARRPALSRHARICCQGPPRAGPDVFGTRRSRFGRKTARLVEETAFGA